jgi:hypothetical protein
MKVIFKKSSYTLDGSSGCFTIDKIYDVVSEFWSGYNVISDLGQLTFMRKDECEKVTTDPIVESVINQFKTRSEIGIKKYGTTLERNDLSTLEWLTHLQEELMDATLYIQRLKQEYDN